MSLQAFLLKCIIVGAAFVALTITPKMSFAQTCAYDSKMELLQASYNGTVNYNSVWAPNCAGGVQGLWAANTGAPSFIPIYAPGPNIWPPGYLISQNYDANQCIIGIGDPVCPGNEDWRDIHGYDSDGCLDGLCPGDPGWTDSEGYDEEGFDSNGLDRGGNSSAQDGGYWGAAGTGGTPPVYIDPPYPDDPQNGDNRDGNNILRCPFAYPITASKSLLPSAVQDGLSGCANECVYQPQLTFFDFDTQQEVVQLVPTGYSCTTEPTMASIEIATYTPPPVGQEPPAFDNLNDCYLNGAFMFCDSPLDPDPPECYVYQSGWIGGTVTCQDLGVDPDPQSCGVFNGVYHCLDPFSNCESYNGTIQCLDPDGNFITHDSPDHIINGGNGDGLDTNDVFVDSADVLANGQGVQDRQLQALSSREIAREIRNELAPDLASINNSLGTISGQLGSIGSDIGELAAGDQTDGESGLSGLVTDIGGVGTDSELTFDGSSVDPISNLVGGFIPDSTGCQVFNYDLHQGLGMSVSLDTCTISTIQPLMEWFLYALTVIALFFIATQTRETS